MDFEVLVVQLTARHMEGQIAVERERGGEDEYVGKGRGCRHMCAMVLMMWRPKETLRSWCSPSL